MTTAVLAANAAATRAAGVVATVFARIEAEFVAFFEEAYAANVRTGRDEPFGL